MRVLLWSPLGAGEHYYGPGAFAHRLYSSAEARALELQLVHCTERQSPCSLFAEIHRLSPTPRGPTSLATYLWQARRWLREHAQQFDVFHGLTGFHHTIDPAFAAERLGLPSVIFVAGHGTEFTDKPGLRGLIGLSRKRRQMLKGLSAVIAMSRAIRDELLEIGIDARRIACIPMGIDTQRFRPADAQRKSAIRQRLGVRNDMPSVAFAGAVTDRKRPHLLVQALGELKQRGVDCQLLLAGPEPEPDYSAAIRANATQIGVADRVFWLGHVGDIEAVYQGADMFALPSASEGMPAALVEAMACGLPAIVTRISGAEDLVEHGVNGWFVEPSSAAVAEAIGFYAHSSSMQATHGECARTRVASSCSNETVLNAYLSLFSNVRQGRDPSLASTLRFT